MAQAAPRSVVQQIALLFEGGAGAGLSDRQLIDRFNARGDAVGEAAFAALVHRHGPMVLDVCQQLLGDLHHAEDAFQAVFLVLARKAAVIRDPDLLGAWLYGVAFRTARKARARLARLRRNEGSDAMRHATAGSRAMAEGSAPSTEQSAIHREQAAVLYEEIDRLPESFRLPVVLCYFEGLTLDDAARRLSWPAGTVRSRLARARDKLRVGLMRRGVVLPAAVLAAVVNPRPAAASVSSVLCQTTTRAAIRFAAGHSVSASASTLAGEVLRSMLPGRSGVSALAVIALTALTAGAGFFGHSLTTGTGAQQDGPVPNAAVIVAAQRKETGKAQPPASAQEATKHQIPQQVLQLTSGRSIAGLIRRSDRPRHLRWQAASDGSLSELAWNEVDAVQWPPPTAWPKAVGEFRFDLAAGDVLFGALRALDERRVELDIPRLGRIQVERSHLHGISRWRDGADVISTGPNGLAGWHEPPGRKDWRNDAGRPATDREMATIRGDFGLPERASIEFEISWTSRPDFAFALGVDDKDITVKQAFRFEVWSSDLVVQRELPQQADLAVVQELSRQRPGRAHFQAYLDQPKGRILVFSPGGAQLADLKATGDQQTARPGLYLENTRGDLRLEWLRIARWDGEVPRDVRAGWARIRRDDGSTLDGELTGLDAASNDFILKAGVIVARIPRGQVSRVSLPAPGPEAPRMIRAIYQDGTRVSGELVRVEDGALTLTAPGIQGPLRLPLAGLRSLVVVSH